MKNSTVSLDVDAAQSAIRRLTSHLESGGVLSSANSLHEVEGPKTESTEEFTSRIKSVSNDLVQMVEDIRGSLEASRAAIEGAMSDLSAVDSISADDATSLRMSLDQISLAGNTRSADTKTEETDTSITSVFN